MGKSGHSINEWFVKGCVEIEVQSEGKDKTKAGRADR